VRLDTANRSFAGLLAASVAMLWVLCGAAACLLLSLIAYRVADDGVGALTHADRDLRPAVAFLALVVAGVALGLRSLAIQRRSSLELARRMRELDLPAPVELIDAARRARLDGRVALVDSDEAFSFTYGAFSPRVVVSRGLLERASEAELHAVLEHEAYHVRNLDPLKVSMARALPATFFYVPVLRDLRARYIAGRELAADRRALEACGRPSLAGALLKVVQGPRWPELRAAAAIGGPELLGVRITQLETGREPRVAGVSRSAMLLSALGLGALTVTFGASVIAFGGPSAVARVTGTGLRPLDVLMGIACATPWAIGGWLAYRWLVRRARTTT
jgi:Zn-dependent protease with chaperone function